MATTVLHRLRISRGLSTRALAAEAGISHATVARIERRFQPGCHPNTRAALERALGVPFDVLLLPEPDTNDAAAPADDGVETNKTPATTPVSS